MGWDRLSNGQLLSAAEERGFELLVTTDQGIRYQHNLASRTISLIVLTGSTKWSRVRLESASILLAVNACKSGSYAEVFISFPPRYKPPQ
jgi:hypothetical protein